MERDRESVKVTQMMAQKDVLSIMERQCRELGRAQCPVLGLAIYCRLVDGAIEWRYVDFDTRHGCKMVTAHRDEVDQILRRHATRPAGD